MPADGRQVFRCESEIASLSCPDVLQATVAVYLAVALHRYEIADIAALAPHLFKTSSGELIAIEADDFGDAKPRAQQGTEQRVVAQSLIDAASEAGA